MRQDSTQRMKMQKLNRKIKRYNKKIWTVVISSKRYIYSIAKENSSFVTIGIKEELFDGILLELAERNRHKSINVQKRILRRIVEKRQAKALFRIFGRSSDLFLAHAIDEGKHKCLERLNMKTFKKQLQ